MNHETELYCPECDGGFGVQQCVHRRGFLKTAAAAVAATPALAADAKPATRKPKPAESLIRELYSTLSGDQKKQLVYSWDHSRSRGRLSRLATYNRAAFNKRLGDHYTKAQQDLVRKILRSILSSDESFKRISRKNRWDASRSFEGCGSVIFGNPAKEKEKFAWVFSGHHLTLRCDGNSEPGAAFGGPVYYGHLVNGYSEKNVFYYQTMLVQEVFESLSAKQREAAIEPRNPGDRERGIQFKKGREHPGIAYSELDKSQKKLVDSALRLLLEPFRKEEAREVMQIVKAAGGMEKIHLAFYKDRSSTETKTRWHFWRLEGPGFIWNYRVLPHVHCYVNITGRPFA